MASKTAHGTENLSDEARAAIAEAEADERNAEEMEVFSSDTDDVFTVPAEMAGHSRPGAERGEEQLKVDSTVESYYEKWVGAGRPDVGKPGGWSNAIASGVVGGYWVTRAAEPDKRKKIKNAALRGNHSVKFGSLGVRLPNMPQDGKLLLSFVIKDVVPRQSRS